MEQLTLVMKDRVGLLADVSELLAKKKINIESLHADSSRGTAIITLWTNSAAKARRTLADAGFKPVDSRVMVVRVRDKPGELAKVARVLSENGVNMKNLYLLTQKQNEKLFALETSDNGAARKALKDYL